MGQRYALLWGARADTHLADASREKIAALHRQVARPAGSIRPVNFANGKCSLPHRQLPPSDLARQLASSDCSELDIVLLLPDFSSSQRMTSSPDMPPHLISSLRSSLRDAGSSLSLSAASISFLFRMAASSSFRIGQRQSHFCRKRGQTRQVSLPNAATFIYNPQISLQ
jgi:hypothetical protein